MFLIVNCGSAPGMLLLFLLARGCISKGNTGVVAAPGSTSNASGSSSSTTSTSSSSFSIGVPFCLRQSLSVFTTVLKMAWYCAFHLQHPTHQHQHHQHYYNLFKFKINFCKAFPHLLSPWLFIRHHVTHLAQILGNKLQLLLMLLPPQLPCSIVNKPASWHSRRGKT